MSLLVVGLTFQALHKVRVCLLSSPRPYPAHFFLSFDYVRFDPETEHYDNGDESKITGYFIEDEEKDEKKEKQRGRS